YYYPGGSYRADLSPVIVHRSIIRIEDGTMAYPVRRTSLEHADRPSQDPITVPLLRRQI
ncbi:unnamed protein product, partial [Nesidiocoris tenuis]